jgi:hypothetical protein|tara:strand:- start:603 stop:794 length:192 start_codon:yes stop_codon:yes gene_type:complete
MKTKQYYWDNAEKEVDSILSDMKNGEYNTTVAKNKILALGDDKLNLVGIDEHNVDEVVMEAYA